MEKGILIEQKPSTSNDLPPTQETSSAEHEEVVAFVENHRNFFEHQARGKVNFAPAPQGLDTFAFDLETNTIYINSLFYKELGFSNEKTVFATLHEIEHFLEKRGLLAEKNGEKVLTQYIKRLKASEAYGLMDNCVADVRENRAVVAKNVGFDGIERDCYRNDLFKDTDFTKVPRHVQFCQALLRESRVQDEICEVAPEVRVKLDAVRAMMDEDGASYFDIFTDPSVSMSQRVAFQNKHIWPLVQELLDKDMEDKEKEQKEKNGGDTNEESDKGESEEGKGEGVSPEDGGEGAPANPNDVFKDAYAEAKKKIPNAIPIEQLEKAFTAWQQGEKHNPLDAADEDYAKKLGVSKEALRQYRNIVDKLEKLKNKETGESIVEELHTLFSRIIAERLKPSAAPRYPVVEGEDLVEPGELVAEVRAGNLEPKVWETTETKERKGTKFGEIEITAVGDRTGSMQGEKLRAQQEALVLMMEALKKFAEDCDEERVNMEQPLEVRSEIYTFQATLDDTKPLKPMSKELGEKERIDVATALGSAPGQSTPDYVPLEAIRDALDEETLKKIKEGELKKIVIVFTDGESDDATRVGKVLNELREKGAVVVGIGITESGEATLTTYAPNARVAETAGELPSILADLLEKHLEGV